MRSPTSRGLLGQVSRRCVRRGRSPRGGRTSRARATASTIVSIGSSNSSGRSIIALAPSVVTAARGATAFTAMPGAFELGGERARHPVERGLARRVGRTTAACCGPSPGSTIALVMLTIQPVPRSRMPGTTALVSRYGVITLTSYATRSRRSEVSSMRQVEARGRVVDEDVDGPEGPFGLGRRSRRGRMPDRRDRRRSAARSHRSPSIAAAVSRNDPAR